MENINKNIVLSVSNLSCFYGEEEAVKKVDLQIQENKVTAVIGPSGCGKSTLLRVFNRMNDFIPSAVIKGEVLYRGNNLYSPQADPVEIRKRIGMVFQRPNPFPKSIYDNIIWGPKLHGYKGDDDELVENSLKEASLWKEVEKRLDDPAQSLSGGQQQRLCIARAIAMKPDVILMDEPCSSLDPRSTAGVEDLIHSLKKNYTILVVTHNMQQATRISDETAFLVNGVLVEFGETKNLFTNPKKKETEDYITGRFG